MKKCVSTFSHKIYFFKVSFGLQVNFTRQGYPITRVNFTSFADVFRPGVTFFVTVENLK